jgi:hypothetical protein
MPGGNSARVEEAGAGAEGSEVVRLLDAELCGGADPHAAMTTAAKHAIDSSAFLRASLPAVPAGALLLMLSRPVVS